MGDEQDRVTLPKQDRQIGIGQGGAAVDQKELILAGATAIEVGTALFANPAAPIKIAKGLKKWGTQQGVSNLSQLVGAIEG